MKTYLPAMLLVCMALLFSTHTFTETPEPTFANWAWDYPEDDTEKNSVTKHYYWNPPRDFISAGIRYSTSRTDDPIDETNFAFGATIRPVIFHLGGDASLCFGAYVTGAHAWLEGSRYNKVFTGNDVFEDPFLGPIPITIQGQITGRYTGYGYSYSTGPSLFFSWPSTGVQMFLEIGHYWGHGRLESNRTWFEILEFGIGSQGRAKFDQRENGMEFFWEFNYLIDRLYLYGVVLDLYASAPTGPREAELRTDVDFGLGNGTEMKRTSEKPIETGFCNILGYLRAVAIEVTPGQRITFEPSLGVGYVRMSHGYEIRAGIRLNILDIVGFSYYRVFQNHNDDEDSSVFVFELGFRVGRRVGGAGQIQ